LGTGIRKVYKYAKAYAGSANISFMEQAGTGVKRVRDACADNGNKVDFRFTDAFWITMHSKENASNKVPDKVPNKVPDKVPDNLTENQQKILKLVAQNKTVSMSKMAKNIGISKRKVLDNINKLKNYGLLKRIGPAKGGYWKVKSEK